MQRLLAAACAAILLTACATGAPGPRPAEGSAISIDGKLQRDEWADARSTQVEGGATLLTKKSKDDLLVGVRLPNGALRYVDLYIQDSTGRILNLHTSMRQGERILSHAGRDADPDFLWEPKSGWEGSTAPRTGAPRTASLRERLARYEGYEMRIPFSLLGPPPWRVRYEIRDFELKEVDWVYPAGSSLSDPATWKSLR